jgi:Glycosyl hydrolase family 30 TIM-barrel domain
MGRVPMAGTDFSTRIYSYDDSDNDFELRNFSLAMEDIQMKIPLIQKAGKIVGQPLNIFASPW